MRYALIQKGIIVPKNNSYDCTEKNDSMIYSKNISPLAGMIDVKCSIETEWLRKRRIDR